ncbi:MAG: (d)CMP kinase [bacterium]|nr:(d)CMP kinase [bacterium]
MIIAIDGPAASGKSTVARALATELGLPFLDTGAMYRAVTLVVLRRGIDPADGPACGGVADEIELDFDAGSRITIDGEPGEPAIRSQEVTAHVSAVAAHSSVRATIVPHQRAIAAGGGAVAEGRDTTTVVFPSADFKFFLVATPRTRAERRAREEGRLEAADEYEKDLEHRDALDSSRADSPLREAEDARRIETDAMRPDEVVARMLAIVRGGGEPPQPPAPAVEERAFDVRVERGLTYRFLMFWVHLGYTWIWRMRAYDTGHVPSGGVLIVSNHQSYLDIPLIAEALRKRHVGFVARASLAKSRVLGFIMRHCGSVLIDRGRGDHRALRETVAHLRQGDAMTIFPEGTRTRDGSIGKFQGGALLAARRARVPIVPCAIRGSFTAWPPGRKLPRAGRLELAFGAPIDPRAKDALEQCRAVIEERLAQLEAGTVGSLVGE